MANLKIEHLKLDPTKESMFKEFLGFTLDKQKPLSFREFQRNCGINRTQWELFKTENLENKEIIWIIE